MATDAISLRLTAALGLTTTLLLSSANISITLQTIPRILDSPSPLLLRQWNAVYLQGKAFFPPASILSASTWAYLSYSAYTSSSSLALAGFPSIPKHLAFALSALLTAGIVPYTGLVMLPTIVKLQDKLQESELLQVAEGGKGKGKGGEVEVTEIGLKREETVHYLVDHWALLNLGRGVMLLAGGLVGAWSILF